MKLSNVKNKLILGLVLLLLAVVTFGAVSFANLKTANAAFVDEVGGTYGDIGWVQRAASGYNVRYAYDSTYICINFGT